MSLFWKRKPKAGDESRSIFPDLPWQAFMSQFSDRSYADVNLSSAEASLQEVAVWAAVDFITSLGSETPFDVYRNTGPDREKLRTPPWLLDPAADGQGAEDWISQLLYSWLLRGNVIGDVLDKNPRGEPFPIAIELKHPDAISTYERDGRVVFEDPTTGEIPASRLFHKRVYPVPGQVLGLSPIRHHAATIGLGIAATRFGRQWFEDGAHPGGILTNSEVELNEPQAKTAKDRFMAALRGTREPIVMGKGWKWDQIQIAPEESQFLETQGFTAAECARIFGPGLPAILGYETGGSLTYTTAESRNRDLLVYTMNRWFRRVERVLTLMLPRGQYVKLNRDAMLESTTLERYRVHEIALRNRIRNVNQVRAIEDEPPVPWGEEPNPMPGAAAEPAEDDDGEDPAEEGNQA